jgi:hypothetical protein
MSKGKTAMFKLIKYILSIEKTGCASKKISDAEKLLLIEILTNKDGFATSNSFLSKAIAKSDRQISNIKKGLLDLGLIKRVTPNSIYHVRSNTAAFAINEDAILNCSTATDQDEDL